MLIKKFYISSHGISSIKNLPSAFKPSASARNLSSGTAEEIKSLVMSFNQVSFFT